jgi:hypothetical protein
MFEEQREYYLTSERTANLLGTGFELLATRLNVNKSLSLLRRRISLIVGDVGGKSFELESCALAN